MEQYSKPTFIPFEFDEIDLPFEERKNLMIQLFPNQWRPVPLSFAGKLHEICSRQDFDHIIRWKKDGESWCIVNGCVGEMLLEREVLPLYFRKETDPDSSALWVFKRRLKEYGFRQSNGYFYQHQMFIRGDAKLCEKMRKYNYSSDQLQKAATRKNSYKCNRGGIYCDMRNLRK